MSIPTEFWLFWITDERTGKRRRTTYRMTPETAKERFGDDAEPVAGTVEIRDLPETYEEQHSAGGPRKP